MDENKYDLLKQIYYQIVDDRHSGKLNEAAYLWCVRVFFEYEMKRFFEQEK